MNEDGAKAGKGEESVGGKRRGVTCPWCESDRHKVISPYGGTVSEMLFLCMDCRNVFGWMKWEGRIPD